VQRHYLHLSQETLGMMGISLFGTSAMKLQRPRQRGRRHAPGTCRSASYQPEDTLQGVLEIIHSFDLILRELSGMDQFIFQAAAAPTRLTPYCCMTRALAQSAPASWSSATRSSPRSRPHPCNAATAAAAGFKVITLQLEENGLSLGPRRLKAALVAAHRGALINNPDDMGIYNPDIKEVGEGSCMRPAGFAFTPR